MRKKKWERSYSAPEGDSEAPYSEAGSAAKIGSDIYGKAIADTKRRAHRKVVEMVLNSNRTEENNGKKEPVAGIGS